MELCHTDSILQNPVVEQLGQFVREHRLQWAEGTPDFEQFEREVHARVLAIERELVTEELAHYDVAAGHVEVEGVSYRPTLTSPETYLSAAGPVTVMRHLYRPTGRGTKSICPLELRAGILAGYFTPRAARQAAFVTAQLTPAESEALFERLKTLLKEADQGADQVIRTFNYQRGRARGHRRRRLEVELTYFRNQRPQMNYAAYLRQGLPIASGVIEATCKTLVTQRLKRSGMAWRQLGGQGILTFRSLIPSRRWSSAWELLPR